MKPWEETWDDLEVEWVSVNGKRVYTGTETPSRAPMDAREKLAKQAPAMARMLQTLACCPRHDLSDDHNAGCQVASLLRAAGIIP